MKAQADRRRQMAIKGHGKYEEIFEEKQFFAYAVPCSFFAGSGRANHARSASKESKLMVCHFYREATERCKIMDMHMAKLAPKHLDTRFIKACREKSSSL